MYLFVKQALFVKAIVDWLMDATTTSVDDGVTKDPDV